MQIKEKLAGGLSEFREFILKGNAFDLAVGLIIGAAFSALVTSLVSDILLPPIGFIMGGIDFSSYFIDLTYLAGRGPEVASVKAAADAGHAIIAYGKFINTLINLLIVGFVIFMLVKQLTRVRRLYEKPVEEPKAPAGPPEDLLVLMEIRDLLARKPAI